MSGKQVFVGQIRKRGAHVDTERSEEFVRQFHAAWLVPKEGFAAVARIGFAPDVSGLDHPIDEVGDRGR